MKPQRTERAVPGEGEGGIVPTVALSRSATGFSSRSVSDGREAMASAPSRPNHLGILTTCNVVIAAAARAPSSSKALCPSITRRVRAVCVMGWLLYCAAKAASRNPQELASTVLTQARCGYWLHDSSTASLDGYPVPSWLFALISRKRTAASGGIGGCLQQNA